MRYLQSWGFIVFLLAVGGWFIAIEGDTPEVPIGLAIAAVVGGLIGMRRGGEESRRMSVVGLGLGAVLLAAAVLGV